MRIYLDVCCLNRPLDNQNQARIRLESEAVLMILDSIEAGEHAWITSDAVEDEVVRIPDPTRRRAVELLLSKSTERYRLDRDVLAQWSDFASQGIGVMDALHLAFAVIARCDILFSTDDRLCTRAMRLDTMSTRIVNPPAWILERP